MKLESATVENFGNIDGPLEVDFDDGLTVIHGSNEAGKSTLMTALRYCLIWPAPSRAREIKDILPHTGGTPEVAVEIECEGVEYRMEKRFAGQNGTASLTVRNSDGTVTNYSGDEADEVLRDALGMGEASGRIGTPDHEGLFSTLWVPQGNDFLDPGEVLADGGTQTLAGVLGEMTGEVLAGDRGSGVMAEVEERYLEYFAPGGNRRRGEKFPLVQAEQEVERVREELDELEERKRRYEDRVERYRELDTKIETLREEELPELREEAREAKETAEQVREYRRERERLETALRADEAELREIESRQQRRETLRDEIEELEGSIEELEEELEKAGQSLEEERSNEEELKSDRDAAQSTLERFRRRREQVASKREALRLRREIEELEENLENVRTYDEKLTKKAGEADSIDLDREDVSTLRDLQAQSDEKQTELRAAAARLEYEARADVELDIAGESLVLEEGATGERLIDEDVSLTVGDVLDLTVRPGGEDLAELRERAEEASRQFSDKLEELGVENIAEAEEKVDRKQALEADEERLEELIEQATPADGISGLERQLAEVRKRFESARAEVDNTAEEDDEPLPDDEEACRQLENELEKELREARQELSDAEDALEAHERQLERIERRIERLESDLEEARERAAEKRATLEEHLDEYGDDAALDDERERLESEIEETVERLDDLEDRLDELDADGVEDRVERTSRAVDMAQDELDELRDEKVGLEAQLSDADLRDLHDDLERARTKLEAARKEKRRQEQRAETLELLYHTLDEARRETRERYLEPLTEQVIDFMERLFPQPRVEFDAEFNIEKVSREDTGERFDQLSIGTRGQISTLVRLAMAKVLDEEGSAPPVFLDDALTDSDDERFEKMMDLFESVSDDLQIIVATCHWDRFRKLGADSVNLDRARV